VPLASPASTSRFSYADECIVCIKPHCNDAHLLDPDPVDLGGQLFDPLLGLQQLFLLSFPVPLLCSTVLILQVGGRVVI